MATLEELVGLKQLGRQRPRLSDWQQPWRRFYYTQWFESWVRIDLKKIRASFWGDDVSPSAQLNDLIRRFVAGDDFDKPGDFRPIQPQGDGVWELKTGDLRVFGWFAEVDVFVASIGDDATSLKEDALGYTAKRMWVRSECKNLYLDPPKYIVGTLASDVIRSGYQ